MSSSTDVVRAFEPARFGLAVEADDVRAEARATGYAAGWAEGRRAAAEQAQAELARLSDEDSRQRQSSRARADAAVLAAVQDWTRRTTPVLDELADLVVEAALDLAQAVVGRELSASAAPERARLALRRALAPLAPGAPIRLRMNPDDLAALEDRTAGDPAVAHEGHLVELVSDPSLNTGDAVAEQDGATVDARVATALARARAVARG
jgi:flagellar assembly protein FliH